MGPGYLLVGVAPLLAYNWWAFESPTHISYSSVAVNQTGFFGLVVFEPRVHSICCSETAGCCG